MGLLSQKGLHVLKVLKFSNGPAKITIIRFSHFRLSARYAVSKFDIFSCLLVHKTKAGYCEQQRLRADHTSPGKLPHCLLHSRVCPPSPSCLQNVTVYRFHCIHFSSPGEIGWASFPIPYDLHKAWLRTSRSLSDSHSEKKLYILPKFSVPKYSYSGVQIVLVRPPGVRVNSSPVKWRGNWRGGF